MNKKQGLLATALTGVLLSSPVYGTEHDQQVEEYTSLPTSNSIYVSLWFNGDIDTNADDTLQLGRPNINGFLLPPPEKKEVTPRTLGKLPIESFDFYLEKPEYWDNALYEGFRVEIEEKISYLLDRVHPFKNKDFEVNPDWERHYMSPELRRFVRFDDNLKKGREHFPEIEATWLCYNVDFTPKGCFGKIFRKETYDF